MLDQPKKRKPGRPKLQNSETKINILRTASFLFMEIGYDSVSLELVAKQCGVTKASVYYYFSNKASLFTACLTYVLGIAYQSTMVILQESIPLKEKLTKIAFRQMSNAHLDFESMMRDASKELDEAQVADIRQAEGKLEEALVHAFQEAIEQGEVTSQHSPIILAHLFTSILTMKNHLSLRPLPLAQLVEETMNVFWQGAAGEERCKQQ